jgi:hypothetical protein
VQAWIHHTPHHERYKVSCAYDSCRHWVLVGWSA